MDKATLTAYRERWKLVEEYQYAEQRAKTIEQRWIALNQLWQFAQLLPVQPREDPELGAIRQRWATLKQRLPAAERVKPRNRVREQAGFYANDPATPLAEAITAVSQMLHLLGNQGIILGGVATSLIGQPRLTRDVDAMVLCDFEDIDLVLAAAASTGIGIRISNVKEFAYESRMLLLIHTNTGIEIDVSLGVLPFEFETVQRAITRQLGMLQVQLPTPEDLIIFKAVAHRLKDRQDIYDIIQTNPNLDHKRIQYWVQQFAEVLEMPELWEDIAAWLK